MLFCFILLLGLKVTSTKNVFMENLHATRNLETTYYVTDNTQALDFVWDSAVKNTVLETAVKRINIVNGEAMCSDCDLVFKLDNIFDSCPRCKSYLKHITKGKELLVKSLEVS